jgi:hypothetical protein
VTLTGFDIQAIGKDLAYTLRAETWFNNFKRNKTTAGVTCTVLNDTVVAGLKLEDRILIGRRQKVRRWLPLGASRDNGGVGGDRQ